MLSKIKTIIWLKPLSFLTAISLIVFIVNRIIDATYYTQIQFIFSKYIYPNDINFLFGAFTNMGEVVTALLGIEITAVAIIVQLSANKYSSKIMELFIADRVNFYVFSIYVVTGVNTMMLVFTSGNVLIPYFSIFINNIFLILSLIIVIPHFAYVFNFLRPENFLQIIEDDAKKMFRKIRIENELKFISYKKQLAYNIDFIGDVALNSVHNSDRAIALLCIVTLKNISNNYISQKKLFPENWHKLSGDENVDPDFANYSSFVLKKIEENKVLFERKVLRLFEIVFNLTKTNQRDISSGILMNTRKIFEQAVNSDDYGVQWTVIKYFNSYLRISISSKDPRSAFNTMEHYRIIGEIVMEKNNNMLFSIFKNFKYYGQEANKNNILFILETAAYDLYLLIKLLHEKKIQNFDEFLELYLTLDEPIDFVEKSQFDKREMSLLGVRIAQVKLAAYFIIKNEKQLAQRIYEDMKNEPKDRIEKIKKLISDTTEEEFWEITPRGINFYYLNDIEKQALKEFFILFTY